MFERQTLFVIGAGASKELNMPVGAELAKAIHGKLNLNLKRDKWGSYPSGEDMAFVRELMYVYQKQPNEWFAASRLIHNGILLTHSIDEFLEIHQDNDFVKSHRKGSYRQMHPRSRAKQQPLSQTSTRANGSRPPEA